MCINNYFLSQCEPVWIYSDWCLFSVLYHLLPFSYQIWEIGDFFFFTYIFLLHSFYIFLLSFWRLNYNYIFWTTSYSPVLCSSGYFIQPFLYSLLWTISKIYLQIHLLFPLVFIWLLSRPIVFLFNILDIFSSSTISICFFLTFSIPQPIFMVFFSFYNSWID